MQYFEDRLLRYSAPAADPPNSQYYIRLLPRPMKLPSAFNLTYSDYRSNRVKDNSILNRIMNIRNRVRTLLRLCCINTRIQFTKHRRAKCVVIG